MTLNQYLKKYTLPKYKKDMCDAQLVILEDIQFIKNILSFKIGDFYYLLMQYLIYQDNDENNYLIKITEMLTTLKIYFEEIQSIIEDNFETNELESYIDLEKIDKDRFEFFEKDSEYEIMKKYRFCYKNLTVSEFENLLKEDAKTEIAKKYFRRDKN